MSKICSKLVEGSQLANLLLRSRILPVPIEQYRQSAESSTVLREVFHERLSWNSKSTFSDDLLSAFHALMREKGSCL
jgi:hypothetical protein